MLSVHPQYITDSSGKRLSVVLSMEEFDHILEELEDAEDVRLYDAAKANPGPSVPIDEAFEMIEAMRQEHKS